MKCITKILDQICKKEWLLFVLLLLVSWTIHYSQFSFPFWDEWDFINEYLILDGNCNVFAPHVEHFKPLFKSFYCVQLHLLGTNFHYWHLVQLAIHAGIAFLTYKVATNFIGDKKWALLPAALIILHPNLAQPLQRVVNESSMGNVLLFLCAFYFLQKFVASKNYKNLGASYFFTFIQVYSFGQGLTLPWVLILYNLLFGKVNKLKVSLGYFAIMCVNAVTYLYFARQRISVTSGPIDFSALDQIALHFGIGSIMNFVRITLLTSQGVHYLIVALLGILVIASLVFLLKKKKPDVNKKILIFAALYFTPLILISLTRFAQGLGASVALRYTYYFLIPISLYIALLCKELIDGKHFGKYGKGFLTALFLVFVVTSIHRVHQNKEGIIIRHMYNYMQIANAAKTPEFQADLSGIHSRFNQEEVVDIYLKFIGVPIEEDPNFERLQKTGMVDVNEN